MGRHFAAIFLVLGALPPAQASKMSPKAQDYVQGRIVNVEKNTSTPIAIGSDPSDAPLPDPPIYAYDVVVRTDCRTYVGRYESWYDFWPRFLVRGDIVEFRLTRHRMVLSSPGQRSLSLRLVSGDFQKQRCGPEH